MKTRPQGLAFTGAIRRDCGALRELQVRGDYEHARYPPRAELREWVEHVWYERWSFPPGARYLREMLPHPNAHLVFSDGAARIYGVQLGLFKRELKGRGQILGVRFWPGGLRPFYGAAVSALANRWVPATGVFPGSDAVAAAMADRHDVPALVARAQNYLLQHLPVQDRRVHEVRAAVETIVGDRSLRQVRQLMARTGRRERTLQRLFRNYVGASASWVIKRYRTYEALERLGATEATSLADLAQVLGYCDQAHFANDFRKRVGVPPAAFRKQS